MLKKEVWGSVMATSKVLTWGANYKMVSLEDIMWIGNTGKEGDKISLKIVLKFYKLIVKIGAV